MSHQFSNRHDRVGQFDDEEERLNPPSNMAPRAGTRNQRQSQPTQSQAPRGTQRGTQARGGRRQVPVEEPMEEDADEQEDGEEGDDAAPSGSMDVDGDQEIARRANDLVRIALFMEHKRMPLRRDDITKKVLAPHGRLFNRVFAVAQDKLRDTFGVELVELRTRAGLDQETAAAAAAAGPSGTQAPDDDLSQARKATGMKKKSAATGLKTYALRSILHESIIALAAEPHEDLLLAEAQSSSTLPTSTPPSSSASTVSSISDDNSDDDGERPPRSSGSIISWSTTDQLGALGVLYVILALILVHGRSMPDMDMRSFLRQLHLPAIGSPIHFTTASTVRSLSVDSYLLLLQRQYYLERRTIGGDGGAAAGNKRLRATQAVRNDDEGGSGQMFEWRWGPRAVSEVGEQKIAEFIGEFMVEGENVAGGQARATKVQKMVEGVEKAAGSKLMDLV